MPNTYLYGLNAVTEAILSGTQIEKIWVLKGSTNDRVSELRHLASTRNIPFQPVPIEKLNTLSRGAHQGVIALVSEITYQSMEDRIIQVKSGNQQPLFVMLDGVTDVRNIGGIARTAECMGAHALILPTAGSASLNSEAIKASAGALMHLPVCREHHLTDTAHLLQSYDIQLIACTEKAKENITEVNYKKGICLVFGSEERGIAPSLLKACDFRAKIPMSGKVNSLNVSVSVGMMMWEVSRQRGKY